MLTIQNLTKSYGDKTAVQNLSLHIGKGEIHAFIGHNGAGKTTTLKCISGILPYENGEIRVDGISVKEQPLVAKAAMAYIPDNPDLYEFLTGGGYLNFIADMFGVSAADRRERITRYAEVFGLTENLGQPVSSYSHGMKQKLALISAFIHQPRLILLDEPFVGLDPAAAFELKKLMRQHCDEGGAIFFSTHVLDVAEKLCDRVSIIRRGELVVSGDMDTVRGDASLEEVFLELLQQEKA